MAAAAVHRPVRVPVMPLPLLVRIARSCADRRSDTLTTYPHCRTFAKSWNSVVIGTESHAIGSFRADGLH